MTEERPDPIAVAGEALRARLTRSAQHQAQSALDAYASGDPANFYVHAGVAIEHAVKARLAAINVFLLTESKNDWFEHGFALIYPERKTKAKVRTVGGREALDRLLKLDRSLPDTFRSDISDAIDARDANVHLGPESPPDGAELLSSAVAFVRAWAVLLDLTPLAWGRHRGLVEQLIAEELDAARVRVEVKFAEARRRERELPKGVYGAIEELALERIEGSEWEVVPLGCPVCGYTAEGDGDITDEGELDAEWNPDGTVYNYTADFFTIVEHLDCSTCGLQLRGTDELVAAGIRTLRIRNERANDSAEFHQSYFEPDYDHER